MDIRPPRKRPLNSSARPTGIPPAPVHRPDVSAETPLTPAQDAFAPPTLAPQPIEQPAKGKKKWSKRKKITLFSILGLVVLLLLAVGGGFFWYKTQLSAVGTNKNELIKVTIDTGTTPTAIGALLKEKGIIRSSDAFSIYTRITRTQNTLQAGTYRLSPAETTPEIVKHLIDGNVDTFSIRFLPGATLAQNRQVLLDAGYSTSAVDTALAATYDSALFDTKPAGTDLEGYIYGETYSFATDATVGDILGRTFAQYEKVITDNDYVTKFAAHGLTLYQGITLASIVQREAIGGDESKIAQVFYTRLADGIALGSDVTYQYIADKTGVARDPNLDSPYNTRRYTGLPPGPISVPGVAALDAVANPASTDYLYFLSGDDDVTYFAHTEAEHQANIAAHCKVKCSTL